MSDFDSFLEYVKIENLKMHAQYIKDFCNEHKNCEKCGMYNGVCRLNDYPANWDMYELPPDKG